MADNQRHDQFSELLQLRRSIRSFKPDPIPEEYIQMILDDAHNAMSGANSQPWEVIVIRNPEIRRKVFAACSEKRDGSWYIEQQREPRYRHPSHNLTEANKDKFRQIGAGWGTAPVYLAVLQDPRKQFGSVLKAQGSFAPKSVLASTMGHFSMVIQLAAASLGLGSARIDVSAQTRFREIMGYPEPMFLDHFVPLGYRDYEPGPPKRLPLEEIVHYNGYDMQKYMRGQDFLAYLEKIRGLAQSGYFAAIEEN